MSAAVKAMYQKVGKNFKTSVFQITMSGNYPNNGETVTLTAAAASNSGVTTITGPNGAPPLGGAVPTVQQLGGWQANLVPAATPGQHTLTFWNGTTQLAAGAYPAAISGGVLEVEIDHDLQGYNL